MEPAISKFVEVGSSGQLQRMEAGVYFLDRCKSQQILSRDHSSADDSLIVFFTKRLVFSNQSLTSWQKAHPALNTSTLRLLSMTHLGRKRITVGQRHVSTTLGSATYPNVPIS